MNISTLHVLNHQGDITVSWDPENPEEVEKARKEVESLRTAGYSFFLVDGTPADAVAAGRGTLNAKRVTAEELIPAPEVTSEKPKRGKTAATTSVAVRPLAGG